MSEVSPMVAPTVAPVTRHIDQRRVVRYAAAARDPNPIHTDPEVAAATEFGRPIAHGMLLLALVSEAMSAAFGERWAAGGRLKVRWRAPAIQPVTVTASATLRSTAVAGDAEDGVLTYDVRCDDEAGVLLMSGFASVLLHSGSASVLLDSGSASVSLDSGSASGASAPR